MESVLVTVTKGNKLLAQERAFISLKAAPGQLVEVEWTSTNRYQSGPYQVTVADPGK